MLEIYNTMMVVDAYMALGKKSNKPENTLVCLVEHDAVSLAAEEDDKTNWIPLDDAAAPIKELFGEYMDEHPELDLLKDKKFPFPMKPCFANKPCGLFGCMR